MKYLINRTDAIGDLILTLPMAHFIKAQDKTSEVIFLVSNRNKEIMPFVPDVSRYIVYDQRQNIFSRVWDIYKQIKALKIDVYIFVGGIHFLSLIAWLSGVKIRLGILSKFSSFLFLNFGTRQPRSLAVMHESEYNINLLLKLNDCELFYNSTKFEYNFKDKEKYSPKIEIPLEIKAKHINKLSKMFDSNFNVEKNTFLLFHPGMTGHTLNWPAINYARTIRILSQKYGNKYKYIISYMSSSNSIDIEYIKKIKYYFRTPKYSDFLKNIYFYDGNKGNGLIEYMSLMQMAIAFVGPSTGPTHLASVLKVPLVSLYSPIKTQSALRWGPFYINNNNKVLVPDVVCGEDRTCRLEQCPYYKCMDKIEADDVIEELEQYLL